MNIAGERVVESGAVAPRLWTMSGLALFSNLRTLFVLVVVAPTAAAVFYYAVIASDLYVAHAEYLVRGVDTHEVGGLGALLNTFGVSRSADDASAVQAYIQSRAAIAALDAKYDLRRVYGPPGADFLQRFPRFWESGSFEQLYEHTRSFISVAQDASTGVTALDVAAFSPEDAKKVADEALGLAEKMVNGLNVRAQEDAISTARKELADARDAYVSAQDELTAFRNREMLVDPGGFARVLLEDVGQLSLERAQTLAEAAQKASLSPDSPGLQGLQARADALTHKIEEEQRKLAGGDAALAQKVSTYERLETLRDLADKRYASALTSLRAAELEAERRQIYIETIVRAELPDAPTRPERLRSALTVFTVSFVLFAVFWIVSVGSRDHAQ